MSKFVFTDTTLGLQPITYVSTTQLHPLGTIRRAYDVDTTAYGEGEFIYLKGVASTVLGSCVVYNPDDYTTTLVLSTSIGPVAFAMAATVASTFGWYQINGKAVGKVAAGFVDDANCYFQSAGIIDDTIVAGSRIQNCKGASAIDTPATGLAELEIHRPFINDGLAD